MSEGLSPGQMGKEIAEHAKRAAGEHEGGGLDRTVTVVEALLLAVVAVLAAWSGYASAKWSTEGRDTLAQAAAARTEASRANLDATTTKDFDSSTFNAWFIADVIGNQAAMRLAEKRFRPEFKTAFDAWIATSPGTNPAAPPGPTYMPQYEQPDLAKAAALDARADRLFEEGVKAGEYGDDYVRTTVFMATVLFLVGISGHFRVKTARLGLVVVGGAILVYAVILLAVAPKPPA